MKTIEDIRIEVTKEWGFSKWVDKEFTEGVDYDEFLDEVNRRFAKELLSGNTFEFELKEPFTSKVLTNPFNQGIKVYVNEEPVEVVRFDSETGTIYLKQNKL